ncbi:MAG: hypothetical protein E7047_04125 [Lentisphaerae bacterium]|nr:hypothetical protein [Lentisphaerota bacterium]
MNDLAGLLPQLNYPGNLAQAIIDAPDGSSLLALDGICSVNEFDRQLIEICRRKQLKVYCEMPFAPAFRRQRVIEGERLVAMTDLADLQYGSLIAVHRMPFIPSSIKPGKVLLALARAAGYRQLAYEMPQKYTPVCFEHPDYPDFIISLLPLSNFVRNRCTPTQNCCKFFNWLFARLGLDIELNNIRPETGPALRPDTPLPPDELDRCIDDAFAFLERSILYYRNDTLMVAEGFASTITRNGAQPWRGMERSDCTFETAGAFAVAARLRDDPAYANIAETLFKRIADDPANRATDPHDPCYGQFTFYENVPTYYASGNAKSAMLLMCALPLAENKPEREKLIMRLIWSLLRTTGRNGLHRPALTVPDSFREHNWDHYNNEDYVNNTPHREAAVLAMFACAYHWTGDEEFKIKAARGINSIMSVYPDLPWTNGYSAELSKLPLVLALMIQIDPENQQYRQYLDSVINDIAARMDKNGALLETLHIMENGLYPPPGSNEAYGSAEASLISQTGDPCCDLVYTQIFALAGLHEAFMATDIQRYGQLRNKMAEFITRIRIKSTSHPEFSGGWMRAFDTDLWEYYGSSSDKFWGAWCMESGWTNAPAAMNLLMTVKNRSLFSLLPEKNSGKEVFAQIKSSMQEVYPLPIDMPSAAQAILGNEDLD